MKFACFSPLYLKIFEKSPFLMKTPSQNFAHHTEVEKHPFGVKTPNLATLHSRSHSAGAGRSRLAEICFQIQGADPARPP